MRKGGPLSLTQAFPPWGIDATGLAARDPNFDFITLESPVLHNNNTVDQFTILLQAADQSSKGFDLSFLWDQTRVFVHFDVTPQ